MLESFIMVTNNRYILWYIVVGLVVADIMLVSMGARLFNREELLGRAIDEINLKWAWRTFAAQFRGGSKVKNIIGWYRYSVLPVLPKLRGPVLLVTISVVATFIGGFVLGHVRPDIVNVPLAVGDHQQLIDNFRNITQMGTTTGTVVSAVLWNVRILLVASILAVFRDRKSVV